VSSAVLSRLQTSVENETKFQIIKKTEPSIFENVRGCTRNCIVNEITGMWSSCGLCRLSRCELV
jgi:hypothetical protein